MGLLTQPLALTDPQFNSLAIVVVALITIVPTTLAAYWAKSANKNSADTAREVRTNGGMGDPNPNINDHVKYQTNMLERLVERQDNHEKLLANHIAHSRVMDAALAEVYLAVRPTVKMREFFDGTTDTATEFHEDD